jgi:hypothetical protein
MTEQHSSVFRDLQQWAGTSGPGADAALSTLTWWHDVFCFYQWYWSVAPAVPVDAAYRLYRSSGEGPMH